MQEGFLTWAINNTRTSWWHDSLEPSELQLGLEHGAVGVTTNPFLSNLALSLNRKAWKDEIDEVFSMNFDTPKRAEHLMSIPIKHGAKQLLSIYEKTSGSSGYICAQVNPIHAGDRKSMMEMAKHFSSWAPNIAVKLPATAAGLDVLEDAIAQGITVTVTVSFTVPQVIATAERYRLGIKRAINNGTEPGKCFAVIMIGRLDDYLRDVAHDYEADISEDDIRQAGVAVTKRAYSIFKERQYEATLIVAALRGTYHMTEIAGAKLIMSIAPAYQKMLLSEDLPHEERIEKETPADVIERLCALPEFVRSFKPDGMKPEEFITFGVTQKTLSQFFEAGWKLLENFRNS